MISLSSGLSVDAWAEDSASVARRGCISEPFAEAARAGSLCVAIDITDAAAAGVPVVSLRLSVEQARALIAEVAGAVYSIERDAIRDSFNSAARGPQKGLNR